jgi:hypothetical protein
MRLARFGLLVFLLTGVSVWAQQPASSQQASPTQQASDPQAVAVIQAAITALGGATAIGQAQTWTFQAQTQGPHSNGNVDYVISTDTDTGKRAGPNGTMRAAPPIHSHFVPALVAAILLKQSQDPTLTIQFGGTSTADSRPATTIVFNFTIGPRFPAQIWTFDAANLPVMVDFRASATIGGRASFPFVVALTDYHQVSGVMYPFQITALVPGKPPQVVAVQTIAPSATTATNEFNGPGGDLR